MATPRKAPEDLQRRGRKPIHASPPVQVAAKVPPEHRQKLIEQYGSVNAGVVEAVKRLVGETK